MKPYLVIVVGPEVPSPFQVITDSVAAGLFSGMVDGASQMVLLSPKACVVFAEPGELPKQAVERCRPADSFNGAGIYVLQRAGSVKAGAMLRSGGAL